MKNISLRDKIRNAGSFEELNKLVAEGAAFPYASRKTRGKWQKAIEAKCKQLKKS